MGCWPIQPRLGGPWSRPANAARSLWLRTWAGSAVSAGSVLGSGKRPVQTTARRGDMGWNLMAALVVIVIASAAGGFLASALARQKKRRVRGPFLIGVFCGFMVGTALAGRRRGSNALGAAAICAVNRQLQSWIGLASGGLVARALTFVAEFKPLPAVMSRTSRVRRAR